MSLQLFNTVFSPFYQSQTQSALILTLSTSPFLFCSFSDIETPPDTTPPLLRHSDEICSFLSCGENGAFKKPPPLWGNSETPCPPRSICHHAECQKASLRLTSGHCSPWHSATEKERHRERHTERENVEQRENEPDKGPETDPSHSAEPGEYAARLSAPFISQMQPLWQCDTDYWKPWFRLSLLLRVASMASAKAIGVCVRMCHMYTHYSSLIHSLSLPQNA